MNDRLRIRYLYLALAASLAFLLLGNGPGPAIAAPAILNTKNTTTRAEKKGATMTREELGAFKQKCEMSHRILVRP